MSKHTPGPWLINPHDKISIIGPDGFTIANCRNSSFHRNAPNYDRQEANARLIAMAPELLEALRNIVNQQLDYERVNNLSPKPGRKYCWDVTEQAAAVIAKIEETNK